MSNRIITAISLLSLAPALLPADVFNPLVNYKSGISVALSGGNGTDWAIERTYHDEHLADQVLYVKSQVQFSLSHNANNTFVNDYAPNRLIGVNGPDGTPNSGDEGIIYYRIDRDMQSHAYSGTLPAWCPAYTVPFSFATLTYDGSIPVLGTTGDNGGAWGSEPSANPDRTYYGCTDAAGNEWHSLTYWDDDVSALQMAGITVHRQGASDGHYIPVCVNPVTPVIQLAAAGADQFYTTPIKTYHIPRAWAQTSYVTAGVQINFINLTDAQTIQYRVNGGSWQGFNGTPLVAGVLFSGTNTTHTLEARCGPSGAVLVRTIVYEPDYPAPSETHGYLLWQDAAELAGIRNKIGTIQPFRTSYGTFSGDYYQGPNATYGDARGGWRDGAGLASTVLTNAVKVAVDGVSASLSLARLAKVRLLRLARLQPVGTEGDANAHTPAKDYLNELGQTIQQFGDAGVAYDILAGCFRQSHHADGITPVEEYYIRDGLAEIATAIIGHMRANYSATVGGGDTHWSHGFELAVGLIALAMPTYKTPYYGVSGADRVSVNDLAGTDGKYWNPYPDQAATWYQVATDPLIPCPGFPGSRYPVRCEFLLSDDGWWTGPNDFQGDGDRYHTGPTGSRLVDINYGGLANAECRVELMEMDGYESPFVTRAYIFENARRIKGDPTPVQSMQRYLRRLLVHGYTPLSWNSTAKTWSAGRPRVHPFLVGFNPRFEFARLPAAQANVDTFINWLNIYYGYTPGSLDPAIQTQINDDWRKVLYSAYELALCAVPGSLPDTSGLPILPPILKPLMKQVVAPGEPIRQDIIAMDLNGDPVAVSVSGLPAGATYDSVNRHIFWDPGAGDVGAYVVQVSAANSGYTTVRPFIIAVMNAPDGDPVPVGPSNLTAQIAENDTAVRLSWNAPASGTLLCYLLYRDGIFFKTVAPGITTYTDREYLPENSHIRYHVSALTAAGDESNAAGATPGYITIPPRPTGIRAASRTVFFSPDVVLVTPNPGGTITRFRAGPDRPLPSIIRVYDASGILVKTFFPTPGQKELIWDGLSTTGQPVKAGLYLCKVYLNGVEKTVKLVHLGK